MDVRDGHIWRLQETPGLGPAGLTRILECYGVPDAAFFARPADWYRAAFRLSFRASKALSAMAPCDPPDLPVRALLVTDPDYPGQLRAWSAPSPVLWTVQMADNKIAKGNISVVCSSGGESSVSEVAKAAMRAALDAGYRLVAGHNRSIYQWALLAAKRLGAPSVMVLDRGLLDAFDGDLSRDPIAPGRIWGYAFEPERCAVLSPFRLRDGWVGRNGRLRDALVLGLSDVVVALAVRPGGGIHRLCCEALARGRTVYTDEAGLGLFGAAGARLWSGFLEPPGSVGARP